MNPLFHIDFYKVGHVAQYPKDTTQVWSNWTPRSTRVVGQTDVTFFGLQYLIKQVFQEEWEREFFQRRRIAVLNEYREVIHATLGIENPFVEHIDALHRMGHLPIKIYALPEGVSVPLNCPMAVITNTASSMFWLPNYLETVLSNILWKPCTSATTARRFRKLFIKYAAAAGEKDFSFIDWMGHDFSFRGMSGREDAILSGMGHLLSFSGTDTIPAILAARQYYGAELGCGGSVPATEHSVMCAGGQDGEYETFKRLLTEVYPSGIVSIVSDTWNLWTVLGDYIPSLKEIILHRQGKLVIRPDSGDPVNIICGDRQARRGSPENLGALRMLASALGVARWGDIGLPLINNAGLIYGDGISVERATDILERTVFELGLSPYNLVFGIGSYTYEYVTRDTYNFAMKATAVRRGEVVHDIFKKPVTDNSGKASHKGIPVVYKTFGYDAQPTYECPQGLKPEALDNCAFDLVFENGMLYKEHTFKEIRERVRS